MRVAYGISSTRMARDSKIIREEPRPHANFHREPFNLVINETLADDRWVWSAEVENAFVPDPGTSAVLLLLREVDAPLCSCQQLVERKDLGLVEVPSVQLEGAMLRPVHTAAGTS